jgi:hypothetical protein
MSVSVRDQAPLHPGNMRLEPGWTLSTFVRYLNDRVFFWPGTDRGPISYGARHYERYLSEGPMIIRVRTASIIARNAATEPLFCR